MCHFKTVGINAKKLKKKRKGKKKKRKKLIYFDSYRDVFVALPCLAVQNRMIQCGKVSDRLDKFSKLQNIANLQDIGFTLISDSESIET